jgi:BirA family biotin operon repressor/biotin-[acetyl-CoA-carboxylase] ligase
MVLYPHFLPIDKNFLLSKAVSLGIANYVLAKSNYIKIKWPNDIYVKDKKIAGILIENTIQGEKLGKSIVGIGLNINQTSFTSDAPNPVSLKQITNKTYSVDQEIIRLRNNIRFFYEKLKAGKFDEINSEYLKYLYRYNEIHTFKKDDELFTAKITGISDFGYLQLLTEQSKKLAFDFKEVEFVI